MTIKKIISGGQTGVDRAALDAALELGIPCAAVEQFPSNLKDDGGFDSGGKTTILLNKTSALVREAGVT